MNIWKKKRIESGLSTYEIAQKLGIREKKYIEVEKGGRAMPKVYVDKFLKITSVSPSDAEINFKRAEIVDWINHTDLAALRKEFGYGQGELEDVLGWGHSSLCNMEKGRDYKTFNKRFMELYDFYHDELNKKINTEEKVIPFKKELTTDAKIIQWLNKTNIKALRKERRLTQEDFAKVIGCDSSFISKLETGRQKPQFTSKYAVKIYNYFNDNLEDENITSSEQVITPTSDKNIVAPTIDQNKEDGIFTKIESLFVDELRAYGVNISKAQSFDEVMIELNKIQKTIDLYNKFKN